MMKMLGSFITVAVFFAALPTSTSGAECVPIYVRWPRVRLTFRPRVEGPYSTTACRSACGMEEHPARAGYHFQCSGFNQKQGSSGLTHDCQIYQADQLQNVDGYAVADDRYSFYWKYCVNTEKQCTGDYQFTFYTDRYMDMGEVARIQYAQTLEGCLAKCLDEPMFTCRSVSFNRTDGGCYLSPQNQLSKPTYVRLNNNPNFRIDYYESNCYSDSFTFNHECRDDGIAVTVESRFAYTGAFYGLYDYFTCRIEPREGKKFTLFAPKEEISRRCADSLRYKGSETIFEVVLSTDGVEPLYFITPEDLTYQARCPNRNTGKVGASIDIKSVTTKVDDFYSTSALPTTSGKAFASSDLPPKSSNSRNGTKISVIVTLPEDEGSSEQSGRISESTTTRRTTSRRPTTTTTKLQSTTRPTTTTTSQPKASSTTTERATTLETSRATEPSSTSTTKISTTTTSQATTTRKMSRSTFRATTEQTTRATRTTATRARPATTTKPTVATTKRPQTTEALVAATTPPTEPILFDVFNRGQPVEAVVVGSRVTLSFTPFYAIPPSYMSVMGCQVEPVDSLFDWEREPLPIVKDGCQADNVGLVCPPERTDFGIRVKVEAFRYQTTSQVQYSCLVRVCPFAPCPQENCSPVEGCNKIIFNTDSNVRQKRQLTLAQIKQVLAQNPLFQTQLNIPPGLIPSIPTGNRQQASPLLQQHLLNMAGDHVVSKRLIVVNTENELQYYLRTGSAPSNTFGGKR